MRNLKIDFLIVLFVIAAALSCSICKAQQYETPESRRRQAEVLKQEEEQKKREADAKQSAMPNLEQKRAEAEAYVGKTFWYLPNSKAGKRVRFYERIPPSSHSQDPNFLFTPLNITSFVVTGIVMAPPVIYPVGRDEYLLQIQFPDGKVGYVNAVGCCGLAENLYKDRVNDDTEYVSLEPAEEILAREQGLREQERLAKERAAREEQLTNERTAREKQRAQEMAERKEAAARDAAERERNRLATIERTARETAEKERIRRAAMPYPRIGMAKDHVVDQTSWGKPSQINRTITANVVKEQWVYGMRRYLYFENGVLTAIQD